MTNQITIPEQLFNEFNEAAETYYHYLDIGDTNLAQMALNHMEYLIEVHNIQLGE